MRHVRALSVAAVSIALAWAGSAAAQARAPKPLIITAQNLTAETASGRADKTVAQPGDEIRYRLVFTNVTAGPVKNIQFVDPIPSGMVYVPGSAMADQPVRVEYSIDGGQRYSARPTVTVVEGGKQVERPALPQQYTHVRWTVLGSLGRGAQVTAEFRAHVSDVPGESR